MAESQASGRRDAAAFTLVELLVTLGIISLLAAILIPAVQAARESVRRSSCLNNLKQLGLALQNYQSAHGIFPGHATGARFSPFVALLPFMEMGNIYNAINVDVSETDGRGSVNETAATTTLSVLLCPSESMDRTHEGCSSYAACAGYGYRSGRPKNGLFVSRGARLEAVTDGASNTAAFAEWLIGPPRFDKSRSYDRCVDTFVTRPYWWETPEEFDAFAEACRNADVSNSRFGGHSKGREWMEISEGRSLYNHNLSINEPTCSNAGRTPMGAWTAASRHPGAANVVFADGHAKSVNDSISLPVWRALGSKAGVRS